MSTVASDRPLPTAASDVQKEKPRASGNYLLSSCIAISESTADPKQPYLGISNSLLYTLVDVYFATAYNASLLLHKASFLESLAGGTATPHVVLSVCAWAANFYRDQNGVTTLRDHGFMIEWAKQAGNLVFQDVQSLRAESIVSFTILGLFWYTQGSWRLSSLYKGV
ncbi:hypothetical protein LTS10_011615 [Elasticomyces elasticus]|nr:hypothetical protein LTS10_011615 [Elasticomyces elasticus]